MADNTATKQRKTRGGSRYPRQKVLMLSTSMDRVIDELASEKGVSAAEIMRALLANPLRRLGKVFTLADGEELTLDGLAAPGAVEHEVSMSTLDGQAVRQPPKP